MRTTLTLEPDVAAQLKRAMRTRGDSLKDTVNAALRAGLTVLCTPPASPQAFKVRPFNLGPSLVGSVDNIEEVLSRVGRKVYGLPRQDQRMARSSNHCSPTYK